MTPSNLAAWLAWLETLHPSEIDLGLERVDAVWRRLGSDAPAPVVITVAGTNGKGSVCCFLEAILRRHGHRVGLYTSPHLERFTERARIDGAEVTEDALTQALERVERARAGVSLTHFEYTTLAILDLFRRARLDVAVLEVGLGGRLDATNVVDPDVAVVTSVGLDHVDWLGPDRASVAREKAGIARRGRPLVLGERHPVAALIDAGTRIGAAIRRPGAGFDWSLGAADWRYAGDRWAAEALPYPRMLGGYQVANAATALAALEAAGFELDAEAVGAGLAAAEVPGRFEVRNRDGVEVVLDIAHNPDAAAMLAEGLRARGCTGRQRAVLGMYRDKDAVGVAGALRDLVDEWFLADLAPPRGASGSALQGRIAEAWPARGAPSVTAGFADPRAAFEAALASSMPGDRIVVLGSFATVAAVR